MRARWGLAGLLAFEAILVVYTFFSQYTVMALVAIAALGWAIVAHARTGRVPRVALGLLAVVTLWRAAAQTILPGVYVPGVLVTYLVPLGFALLLWPRARPALGVGLVAAARTWFVLWYFLASNPTLALANLVGAAGAWLWWSDAALVAADESAAQTASSSR